MLGQWRKVDMKHVEMSQIVCQGGCGAPIDVARGVKSVECEYCRNTYAVEGLKERQEKELPFTMLQTPDGVELEYKELIPGEDAVATVGAMSLFDFDGQRAGLDIMFAIDKARGTPFNLNIPLDQLNEWDIVASNGALLGSQLVKMNSGNTSVALYDGGGKGMHDMRNAAFGRVSVVKNLQQNSRWDFGQIDESLAKTEFKVQIPWQEGLRVERRNIATEAVEAPTLRAPTKRKKVENPFNVGCVASIAAPIAFGLTLLAGELEWVLREDVPAVMGEIALLWVIALIVSNVNSSDRKTVGRSENHDDEDGGENGSQFSVFLDADGGINIANRGTMGEIKQLKNMVVKDGKRGRHF